LGGEGEWEKGGWGGSPAKEGRSMTGSGGEVRRGPSQKERRKNEHFFREGGNNVKFEERQ